MSITGNKGHGPSHVPDEDIVRFLDGELTPNRTAELRKHFEVCGDCRTHLLDFQNTVSGFNRFQSTRFEQAIPPIEGPRARLRASLEARRLDTAPAFNASYRLRRLCTWGFAAAAAILAVALLVKRPSVSGDRNDVAVAFTLPLTSLTPGETVPASAAQVCSATDPIDRIVPAALSRQVFAAYGLHDVRPEDFQVDYLISPSLGGADSMKNLWPEPYFNTEWNARVKDALEVRLREMVCSGKVDLKTAQFDLSSNWIRAYKKYFNTGHPVESGAPIAFLVAPSPR